MPAERRLRIGLVMLHTSVLATPGVGDAGGMNVLVGHLADELARAGHDVEVLTRAESEDAPTLVELPSGARVRLLTAGPRGRVAKGELPGLLTAFSKALTDVEPFDVLHSHYWLSAVAAAPAAAAWGIPHLLSLHTVAALKNQNLSPGDDAEPQERVLAEGALVRSATMTIASTDAERKAITAAYDAPEARVVVVSPGVDTELFHAPDATPGDVPGSHPPVLLVAGRIQPLKGQDLAIRALGVLADTLRREPDAGVALPMLLLVGESTPGQDGYRQSLTSLVQDTGLESNVVFVGAVDRERLAALMRQATLLLIPSHSETFGLVALEAAASGLPVVARRTTGLCDSVIHGETGVLVDAPADAEAAEWADAIRDLLADPARRSAMSAAGTRHAASTSWAATAAGMLRHYADAVEAVAQPAARASGSFGSAAPPH